MTLRRRDKLYANQSREATTVEVGVQRRKPLCRLVIIAPFGAAYMRPVASFDLASMSESREFVLSARVHLFIAHGDVLLYTHAR